MNLVVREFLCYKVSADRLFLFLLVFLLGSREGLKMIWCVPSRCDIASAIPEAPEVYNGVAVAGIFYPHVSSSWERI